MKAFVSYVSIVRSIFVVTTILFVEKGQTGTPGERAGKSQRGGVTPGEAKGGGAKGQWDLGGVANYL